MFGKKYNAKKAEQLASLLLERMGLSQEDAEISAKILITADLFGRQTHGLERLNDYEKGINHLQIVPSATPELIHETPTSALLDAHRAMGHSTAYKAMKLCIQKAKTQGIGMVLVKNSNHYGIAGYYPYMAIQEHLFGLSVSNSEGLVVPTGGKRALLGSNPIAAGMYAEPYPYLLDMSTAVVPRGKVELFRREGKPLENGWAINEQGEICSEPATVSGCISQKTCGGILPLGGIGCNYGGHKGYGLSLLVEILTGIFACGPTSSDIRRYNRWDDDMSQFFLAIDYAVFEDPHRIEVQLSHYLQMLRDSERMDADVPIQTTGQPEWMLCKKNQKEGIDITDTTYADLIHLGDVYQIDAASYLVEVSK